MLRSSNTATVARNTLLLYVRMAVVMLVSLYTGRVVLDVLGVADYGVYNVVSGIVVLFSFLNTALSNSSQRYLSIAVEKVDKDIIEKTFSVCLALHLILAAVLVILCETAGLYYVRHFLSVPIGKEHLSVIAFHLAVAATIINVLRVPFYAVLIAYENMAAVAYLSIAEAGLKLAGVLVLPFIPGEKLIVYSFILLGVYLLVLLSFSLYSLLRYHIKIHKVSDWKLMREFAGFSGWNMLGGVADIAYQQGTNLLINNFFGVTVNAAVGVMNQVRTAVYSLVYNMQLAANPQIIKSYSAGDKQWFQTLISLVSRTGYALMLILGIPLILNMDYVLNLWLVSVPEYTVQFCNLILVFCVVDSLTGPLWVSMQATGRISLYSSVTGIILLLNLPFSYFALKAGCPPWTVYVIQIILCVVSLAVKLRFAVRYAGLMLGTYIRTTVLPLLAVTAISVAVTYAVSLWYSGFFRLLLTSLVGFLSVSASMFYIGLRPDERVKLKSFIRRKLRR